MNAESRPAKRMKLEPDPPLKDVDDGLGKPVSPPEVNEEDAELEEEHCSICLQALSDRTLLPACSHEFCFDCILIWTEQSRKCPLCARQIGDYLIHNVRSKYDYQKHYLAPLRTSPGPDGSLPLSRAQATQRRRARREVEWGRNVRRERERERQAADELERAIEKRRWVYRHHLYAKHVASNPHTRYRPFPTPQQFAANADLISRATIFIRRELRVWDSLDVEFLTTFTISIMKQLDIRSEPAVKLIAEFLDMDNEGGRPNAEHFAHELYSYLRSPFRDLSVYDSVVQYDAPEDLSPPRRWERSRRFASASPSPPPSRSPSPGPSRRDRREETRPRLRSSSRDARRRREATSGTRRRRRSASSSRERSRSARRRERERASGPASETGDEEWSTAGARDRKGKSRAIDVGRGMEAGTYMHRQPANGSDHGGRAVGGGITSSATAAGGQSDDAENKSKGPSAGAGVVGPGGLDMRDGAEAFQTAAQPVEAARPRANKEERPKVDRERWKSLNTYLTGPPTGVPKRPAVGRRSSPDSGAAHQTAELSIRGAARRGGDPATGPLAEDPSTSSTPAADGRPVDRTTTGTPALQATTPDVSESTPALENVPMNEVLERTRARLAKLKAESLAQAAEGGAADSRGSPSLPHTNTEGGTRTGPAPPALLPMAMANTVESPRPSTSTGSRGASGADASSRARLLERLAHERRAHLQDHDAGQRHGDGHADAHPGLSGVQHEQAGPALDAAAAADVRRDAAMLEAALRAQARLRVSGPNARPGDRVADGGPSACSGAGGAGGQLRTREEALRAKLRRKETG